MFPSLPPAGYVLTVVSKGFQTYQQTGVVLQADQSITVNAKLAVGLASETVEVTEAAAFAPAATWRIEMRM